MAVKERDKCWKSLVQKPLFRFLKEHPESMPRKPPVNLLATFCERLFQKTCLGEFSMDWENL